MTKIEAIRIMRAFPSAHFVCGETCVYRMVDGELQYNENNLGEPEGLWARSRLTEEAEWHFIGQADVAFSQLA